MQASPWPSIHPCRRGRRTLTIVRWADPGYFAAIKIPLLRGRNFGSDQRLDAANEVIISAEFARQYFPNEDPIGKHLLTLGHHSYEVVGVVGDTRFQLASPKDPTMYVPIDNGTDGSAALVIRAAHDPESLALPIQKTVQQMDRELAVSDVLTMNQIINKSSIDANFEATLLAAFAGISLLLAAVGLFGVLAYLVTQRRTEIGIRLALGAQREHVLHLMLLDGLAPALGGAAAGSLLAIAAAQLIRRQQKGAANHSLAGAVIAWPAFERFVFVMSVLEGYSLRECSTLLGCKVQDVIESRSAVLQRLADQPAQAAAASALAGTPWNTLLTRAQVA